MAFLQQQEQLPFCCVFPRCGKISFLNCYDLHFQENLEENLARKADLKAERFSPKTRKHLRSSRTKGMRGEERRGLPCHFFTFPNMFSSFCKTLNANLSLMVVAAPCMVAGGVNKRQRSGAEKAQCTCLLLSHLTTVVCIEF